jgi:hypothetical protein
MKKLWTWPEAVGLISTWTPPVGIEVFFSVRMAADVVCFSVRCTGKSNCTLDASLDPHETLEGLHAALDWLSFRLLAEHGMCTSSAKLRKRLDHQGDLFDRAILRIRLKHRIRMRTTRIP